MKRIGIRDQKSAVIAATAAYVIWGLMPIYWRIFAGISPFVVFLHRCLWAFPFLFLFMILFSRLQKKWLIPEWIASDRKRFSWLCLSAVLIGGNWWIYIYGVESHQVLEMSLGYFFSPLLSAAMGVVFLKERLTRQQWIGAGAVVIGVCLYSFSAGRIPTMAIGLALTFSFYGLIRKLVNVHPLTALSTETFVLMTIAAIYAVVRPPATLFGEGWAQHHTLLVFSGALTAVPLLWFAVGVRGLSMTTMGMLNYISPTGKFLIAVLVFGEVIEPQALAAFGLIWSGIAVYLFATYHKR
ncbi:MAG: EamA family transporter RarD [Proteobacteria bacterium]|nr:EamA family transporter RarD [Pseudomonadota bacterium]